ncbi:MAG: SUMF1/EgtB/PvdO family nonheme iron enzyme [Chloroflexi bacterium]|nr:SUMF1/EgtB/PvdO family nonheme iron enzyme [Chloroflexota bacterium]
MAQLFFSYSRVDSAFVERLLRRVQQAFPHLTLWYDRSPHGLIGGDNWWDEILKAIAESDVFIYVLSNESVKSLYCQAEFTEARRLQKRIITIQARDRTELTDDLDDIQFIDMKDGPDDPDALQRLNAAIYKQLSLAKKLRPLWKPATPKPQKETQPTRRADAPEVVTPPLRNPVNPHEEKPWYRDSRFVVGAILVPLIVAVVGGLFSLINNAGGTNGTPAAQQPTNEPLTSSATQPSSQTPTDAPTLEIAFIVQTLEAQATLDQATATLWTDTPTPTRMPTLSQVEQLALTPITRNADWQPHQRDFNGVLMVLVPVGCFMMGSEEYEDTKPAHQQCFDEPFWLDKTEVTNAQFAAFNGISGRASNWRGGNRPREQINWFEAHDFCTLRDTRLPTEAEWEYAARGPDGLVYPWGNNWNEDHAVWGDNSNHQSADVGSHVTGTSWVGAQDLSGNVWEWVSSLFQPYPYDKNDGREDKTGNRTNVQRVLRGGSWGNSSDFLRIMGRLKTNPDMRLNLFGFRCARDFE